MIRNEYTNQWEESNHKSHICNIEYLPFEMVNHYPEQLPFTIINEV